MRFLGALVFALGNPDKNRSWNIFHPLFGAGLQTCSCRGWLAIVAPTLFFILSLVGLMHQYSSPLLNTFVLICNLIILICGFLKISVSSVLIDRKRSFDSLKEGVFLMLVAGAVIFINHRFIP